MPDRERTMNKRDRLKSVMVRLTPKEYARLNHARRRNNLDSLSDNQIVRKLLFDQLDQEEERHEPNQRHAPAVGIA
jgi:hypothetical protein